MATETPLRTAADRNLKDSFIALGLLIVSAIVGFLGQDMLMPGNSSFMFWAFIGLAFFMLVMAVIYAIITLTRAIKDEKEKKSGKNQGAIFVCIIVLASVAYEILSRLMF